MSSVSNLFEELFTDFQSTNIVRFSLNLVFKLKFLVDCCLSNSLKTAALNHDILQHMICGTASRVIIIMKTLYSGDNSDETLHYF